MARSGEKMLNFDVPQELWDRFHEFFKQQGGIDKKVLGAWAIQQFIETFDLGEAGEYRNEFTEWMKGGNAPPGDNGEQGNTRAMDGETKNRKAS